MDMIIQMGITVVLAALKESIKDTKKKAALRQAMLKIYNAIGSLYAGDLEFAQ